MSLRTPLENWKYQRFLKSGPQAPLSELPALLDWSYWKLVEPISKHNRHHSAHFMIVLKRECSDIWGGLTNNEIYELWREVMPELDSEYHYFKINFKHMRSVNGYVHFHIYLLKRRYW